MSDVISLYIDLLKKCVSNSIYDDDFDLSRGDKDIDPKTGKRFVVQPAPAEPYTKYIGGIWPSRAHTMIGIPRLENIQQCIEEVLKNGIRGDFIEAGVWRGGAVIFMRGILKAYGVEDRRVWVADSFEGLPVADFKHFPKESDLELHTFRDLAISMEEVQKNFERYDLMDDQVRFLKGWFRDTLPNAPITELAVMRLDGDMYESTMDGLVNLYPKLSVGGFVIIDDYNAVKSCNAAVEDFRQAKGITTEMRKIPGVGAFWKKQPGQ